MANPDNSALDDARKRARRRLVGAVVLALAAAVVLPMFLESEPKPLGPDIQVQIPAIDDAKFQNRLTPAGPSKGTSNEKVVPRAPSEPAKAPQEATDSSTPVAQPTSSVAADATTIKADAPAAAPTTAATPGPGETKAPKAAAAAPTAARSQNSAAPAKPASASSSAAPAPVTTPPSAAPARNSATLPAAPASAPAASLPAFSLTATAPVLDSGSARAPSAPAAQGEFVVQLGAFVDSAVANDLAARAGAQGFSVFLEAVTTKGGQVQRVRVGPFATRDEADAAAARLKAAGFTAVARSR